MALLPHSDAQAFQEATQAPDKGRSACSSQLEGGVDMEVWVLDSEETSHCTTKVMSAISCSF